MNIPVRLVNLDALRGLAAVSVCVFHFTNSPVTNLPANHPVRLLGWHGHLGVYVFFVLSAIVIPYSMYTQSYNLTQAGRFLRKRFLRLEPPYLFSLLLAVLLNYFASRSSSYTGWPFYSDGKTITANATHLAGFLHIRWIVVVYWTLTIEWQFYVLIIALYPLLISSKDYLFWLSLLIVNLPVHFIETEKIWFTYAGYFSVGFLVFRYLVGRIDVSTLLFGVLLLTIHISWKFSIAQGIAAALPVLVIFLPPVRFYPLPFLSTISYSLYLTHLLTGYNFLKLSRQYATTIEASLLLIIMATILSLSFAYVTYRVIEQPARTLVRRS